MSEIAFEERFEAEGSEFWKGFDMEWFYMEGFDFEVAT